MTTNRRVTEVVNNTGSTALFLDQVLTPGQVWEIIDRKLSLWRDDLTISGAITSGTLGVRDGEQEFSNTTDALQYFYDNPRPLRPTTIALEDQTLLTVSSGVDEIGGIDYTLGTDALLGGGSVTVESGTNTITISGTGALGDTTGDLIQAEFTNGGNTSNTWLSISTKDHASNQIPFTMVHPARIAALGYSNSLGGSDIDFELHRSPVGSGSVSTAEFIWEVRDARVSRKTDFTDEVVFAAGDKLGIFAAKVTPGDFPKDVILSVYIEITGTDTGEDVEDYSGSFTT